MVVKTHVGPFGSAPPPAVSKRTPVGTLPNGRGAERLRARAREPEPFCSRSRRIRVTKEQLRSSQRGPNTTYDVLLALLKNPSPRK